ncbi:MAG: hypothetical protein IH867_07060 [Chloroflexi bacterium]|nr:hypothetical protein [Chloroflexota bacterium]
MDQVLASRAFKYQIQADPETERMLRVASVLGGAKKRTPNEERVFQLIKETLKHAFLEGTSPIERLAEMEADEHLRSQIEKIARRITKKEIG